MAFIDFMMGCFLITFLFALWLLIFFAVDDLALKGTLRKKLQRKLGANE